jgi:hypothetical protein
MDPHAAPSYHEAAMRYLREHRCSYDVAVANVGDAVDGSAEFTAALNDPSRWKVNRAVPYFEAHTTHFAEVRAADGRILRPARTVTVSDDELEQIAAETARMEAAGQFGTLTPGHKRDGKAEHEQPPVWGYLKNPRVVASGPGGKKRLVFDEYLYPQHHAERGQYPYRSVDFFPRVKQIFGAAVLKQRPRLNLGTYAYVSGTRGDCFPYSIEGDDWDALVAAYRAETALPSGGIPHKQDNLFEAAQPSQGNLFLEPQEVPPYFEAAMELVRSRRISYDQAVKIVKEGK